MAEEVRERLCRTWTLTWTWTWTISHDRNFRKPDVYQAGIHFLSLALL
jgi:hypothetical protein